MNKKVLIIITSAIFALFSICSFKYTKKLQKQNTILTNNQALLLDSLRFYIINDSLNVSKINMLELTLADYKKYRAEDAALIKKLKAGKLSSSTTTSIVTKTEIKTVVKDTIIYKDTIKQIKYDSYWTSIRGYLSSDSLNLNITNREELLIAQSYVNKRFLGIKLPIKLFGYKTKRLDAISKNPNTKITNLEYIQIYN